VKTNVLILGGSHGSLFSTKLLLAGHHVSLVCHKTTAELINREGTVVRFNMDKRFVEHCFESVGHHPGLDAAMRSAVGYLSSICRTQPAATSSVSVASSGKKRARRLWSRLIAWVDCLTLEPASVRQLHAREFDSHFSAMLKEVLSDRRIGRLAPTLLGEGHSARPPAEPRHSNGRSSSATGVPRSC
jgi:hypothetical protein